MKLFSDFAFSVFPPVQPLVDDGIKFVARLLFVEMAAQYFYSRLKIFRHRI